MERALISEKSKDEENECIICMTAQCNIILPCMHSFCQSCIQRWSLDHSECPFCRQNFSQMDNVWVVTDHPGHLEVFLLISSHFYFLFLFLCEMRMNQLVSKWKNWKKKKKMASDVHNYIETLPSDKPSPEDKKDEPGS